MSFFFWSSHILSSGKQLIAGFSRRSRAVFIMTYLKVWDNRHNSVYFSLYFRGLKIRKKETGDIRSKAGNNNLKVVLLVGENQKFKWNVL